MVSCLFNSFPLALDNTHSAVWMDLSSFTDHLLIRQRQLIVSSRPAQAAQRDPVSKKKKENKQKRIVVLLNAAARDNAQVQRGNKFSLVNTEMPTAGAHGEPRIPKTLPPPASRAAPAVHTSPSPALGICH
jgi:hypothetical protein